MTTNAKVDENGKPTLIVLSSANDGSIVQLWGDPVSHALLTQPSSGNAGFQEPTGVVNGINQTFVFTIAPSVISVDSNTFQKVSSNGNVNWTGTTSVVLTVAPNADVFGIA